MAFDQRTLERIASRLPEGYDPTELRVLETRAQILPDEWMDDEAEAIAVRIAGDAKVAGPPMINKDGRPTILKVAMWMCHGDVRNLNGDGFVMEELKEITPSLFQEPNFGVMDWNHSAIYQFGDDPKLMGVWYKADYAWDKAANKGKGAWGVLVTGMMFAWLFPEQTDALIAEQLRSGSIKGSMACIPKSVEFGDLDGERCAILHNPVFFTHSLLDVPPADPDAVGRVTEDPDTGPDVLKELCMSGLPDTSSTATATIEVDPEFLAAEVRKALTKALAERAATEESMTPEQIAELQSAKTALETQVAELTARLTALETELAEAKSKKAPPEDKKDDDMPPPYKKKADELETQVTTLTNTVAELTTSRDALASELEAATAKIAEQDAKIAELQAVVDAAAAAKSAAEREERLAARVNGLPESFRKAHKNREEKVRTDLEASWADMTDEQWESHKTHVLLFGFASGRTGYVSRSEKEGVLLQSDASIEDMRSKLKGSLRQSR